MSRQRTEENKTVHAAVNELHHFHEEKFVPTKDIDVVWAISSLGTVKQPATPGSKNPYDGGLWNLEIVNHAVQIVLEVTALRLDKKVEEVTLKDIEAVGPTLLYNGESIGSSGNYPLQNQHFEELINEPGFPVPLSNIVIGKLDEDNTPGQVRQIASYVREREATRKIAVVCGLPHTTRVGRYLEHLKGLFSDEVSFAAAPVAQGDLEQQSKIAAVEVRKMVRYRGMGHLATKSIFFPDSAPDRRPDVLRSLRLES